MAMWLGRFLQLQRAILKNQVIVRRDDVDAVRLDDRLTSAHKLASADSIQIVRGEIYLARKEIQGFMMNCSHHSFLVTHHTFSAPSQFFG